jgi:ABC-type antimicrobial peptide transport system permease subunit
MGGEPRHLLWTLFSRASAQVGAGVTIGIGAAALLDRFLADGEMLGAHRLVILAGVSVAMGTFALLAALMPARAALRISPTEALKAE